VCDAQKSCVGSNNCIEVLDEVRLKLKHDSILQTFNFVDQNLNFFRFEDFSKKFDDLERCCNLIESISLALVNIRLIHLSQECKSQNVLTRLLVITKNMA